ncbi:MAG: hypothetical protein RMJ98_08345 [Myxococcales bacterium]|nr:hypothetical protein [Polyangiaceae bacterium]MDW8249296.1 hypothetical protein [Myxococcales bacterium]
MTGKLSDVAGLFAAPVLLASLLGVRSRRGLLAAYGSTGLVFAAIKASATASGWFVGLLALVGLRWRNWVDPTDLLALPALWWSWRWLTPAMQQEAHGWRERAAIALGLPVMLASGDGNLGGANEGGKAPGSGDTGIDLAVGEIAVDPQGRYFVSQVDGKLKVADLDSLRFREIKGLPKPTRLAFWPASVGQGFFLLSTTESEEEVISYDLGKSMEVWRKKLPRRDEAIQVDEAGSRLVLWQPAGLVALTTENGSEVGEITLEDNTSLVDVDLVQGRLITTVRGKPDGKGLPTAQIHLRALEDLTESCPLVVVPNCADELVIAGNGKRAFLAPTFCGRDPVSVIDLEACTFDKNLPGFGPVALSDNGRTAVAFLDRDNDDPQAPPIPDEVKKSKDRYHLMFLDTNTLVFGTTPIGQELPRYAVTPDGQLLLVDAWTQAKEDNVRIVDTATKTIRQVSGPSIQLSNYVMLPDSTAAFVLHEEALYELDIVAAQTSLRPLSFTPTHINRTPKGDKLLLRDTQQAVHLYDVAFRKESGVFSVE